LILSGTLTERTKQSAVGTISGFSPHHTVQGCPPLRFDDNGEALPDNPNAAAIEASFVEAPSSKLGDILSGYGRQLNMVHLQFGKSSIAPTPPEAQVLREAGEIFRRNVGVPTLLVVLPIHAAGAYGVSQGRIYPIGLFNTDGKCQWLHPNAHHFIKAEFPANQVHRSTAPKPTQPAPQAAPPEPHWYPRLMALWEEKKPNASKTDIHELVIDRRAERLLDDGIEPTKTKAIAAARKEAQAFRQSQTPAAAPLRTSTGPQPAQTTKLPAPKLTSARIKP
jgi:hypothetical protein